MDQTREHEHTDSPTPRGTAGGPRSRVRLMVGVLIVVALGMLVRHLPGELGNLSASAMFTVFFGLVIALVTPRTAAGAAAVLAMAGATVIELLQLGPLPALVSEAFPPAYWLMGTTFSPLDLVGYGAGAGLVGTLLGRGIWNREPLTHPGAAVD